MPSVDDLPPPPSVVEPIVVVTADPRVPQQAVPDGDTVRVHLTSPDPSPVVPPVGAAVSRRELCAAAATRRASSVSQDFVAPPVVDVVVSPHSKEVSDTCVMDAMMETSDDHGGSIGWPSVPTVGMDIVSGSIPSILNRVLMAEHDNIRQLNDLLVLAVHAVMLETGFVLVVEGRGRGHEAYTLSSGWSGGGDLNLAYTVPNIRDASNSIGHVVLRSQTLGNNVIIYGTINMDGVPQPVFRLVMKISKYLIGHSLPADGEYISVFSDPFALWKCVKDELSLPLLTVFCKRAGLPPPPSLLMLPMELKMKILECLPALDLARVGSVCSELRYLCANNELWKRLFIQEFGSSAAGPGSRNWKSEFEQRFVERKRALERRPHPRPSWYGIASRFTPRFPSRRGIIGGDYDIYPSIGQGPFGGGMFGAGGASGSGGFLRGLHERERTGQDVLGVPFPHEDEAFF